MDPASGADGETELARCTYNRARPVTSGHRTCEWEGTRRPAPSTVTVEEFIMREFATLFPPIDLAVDEAPAIRGDDHAWDDEEVIDTVLRLVADHHRAVGAAIGK